MLPVGEGWEWQLMKTSVVLGETLWIENERIR